MLDIKFVRQNPDIVRKSLENRGATADLDKFLELDEERRNLLFEVEKLKNLRNSESEEIARKKMAGEPVEDLIARMKEVSQQIKEMDDKLSEILANVLAMSTIGPPAKMIAWAVNLINNGEIEINKSDKHFLTDLITTTDKIVNLAKVQLLEELEKLSE